MAVAHAAPGEVIDVRPLGKSLAAAQTVTLVKTQQLEILRMVMTSGKEISQHKAPGEIVVQCLEGKIAFTTPDKTVPLEAGQLLYLAAEQPHAVRCLEDASFLLTLRLP